MWWPRAVNGVVDLEFLSPLLMQSICLNKGGWTSGILSQHWQFSRQIKGSQHLLSALRNWEFTRWEATGDIETAACALRPEALCPWESFLKSLGTKDIVEDKLYYLISDTALINYTEQHIFNAVPSLSHSRESLCHLYHSCPCFGCTFPEPTHKVLLWKVYESDPVCNDKKTRLI